MQPTVIYWFRKGLRLHDNPALQNAIDTKLILRPVFILDPWFVMNGNVGENRWRFLQQALVDLDSQLKKLDSRLYVVRGKPEIVFSKLFTEWNVCHLSFEVDTEPYAKQRDAKIKRLAQEKKIEVYTCVSHTLHDVSLIVKKNNNKTPTAYKSFLNVFSSMGPPAKPYQTVNNLPNCCKPNKDELINKLYCPPTLEELGLQKSKLQVCLYPGGESEGLKRLNEYICESKRKWVCEFEKPKTSPNSLKPSTTVLSPYLKFGCVSVRLFYSKLQEVYKNQKHTQPPVSLLGQLLWREFYYTCGASIENFGQMKDNPICKQINWDVNNENLSAWKEGRTGYPYIDAIMTQLKNEGWVHHLARHSVACFLTRGDLWISWEEGARVFEEYLLDADWSLNVGNWLWLSASAFFHQYYRVYSPIVFGKKTDPEGVYIKRYLPVLQKLPKQYIYKPWEAPLSVQKAAGCIIGKDYPKPIVDHAKVSKINVERMKEAYNSQLVNVSSTQATSITRLATLTTKHATATPKPTSSISISESGPKTSRKRKSTTTITQPKVKKQQTSITEFTKRSKCYFHIHCHIHSKNIFVKLHILVNLHILVKLLNKPLLF